MTNPHPTSRQLFRASEGTIWSPMLFAAVLDLSASEMAFALGMSESFMRLNPNDAAIQKKLDQFADIFDRLLDLNPDVPTAAFHIKNTSIRVLDHQTLLDVLRNNEFEKAFRYLQTVSGGQSG